MVEVMFFFDYTTVHRRNEYRQMSLTDISLPCTNNGQQGMKLHKNLKSE